MKKSQFFLFMLFSPAFIFGWLIYSPRLDFQPYLVILALAALGFLGSVRRQDIWYFLFALFIYGVITQLSILSIFALPFFLYAVWCSERPASKLITRIISASSLIAIALLSATLKIQWGDFHIARYIQSAQFYAGFMLLLILSLSPLFFIRLKSYQGLFYGLGLFSIFILIGFGFDWGYCIHLYISLLFISLIFSGISFTPAVSKISPFLVVLFALLWNIPAPFVGLPGLGVYGVIYKHYPVLRMEDPLKHPFWREAAERYSNIQIGRLRNALPPDSDKLRFLLGRVGMQNITFVDSLNLDLKPEAPNSNTLYLLDDWRFSPSLRFAPDTSVDLMARIDGYLVYAPGWKVCKDCREIAKDLQIDSLPPRPTNNDLISFADGQSGVQLLGEGWSKSESWGTWSDRKIATLLVPKPDRGAKKLILNLRALISPKHTNQVVRVLLDGKSMGRFTLDKGEMNLITLDLASTQSSFYKIEFDLENPARPADLGMSKDQRLLGIGLVSLRFE
ncbi:MAG: hypothetical protein HQ456_01375 [Polynucleobacter sp.]|nr:hypothetical protein [Polynucleobacter sp.]